MSTIKTKFRPRNRWAVVVSAVALTVTLSLWIGMSWAWFTDSNRAGISAIESATFDAGVSISGIEPVQRDSNVYDAALTEGEIYSITITVNREVTTARQGYCAILRNGEIVGYTGNLVGADPYIFDLYVGHAPAAAAEDARSAESLYTFEFRWGSYPAADTTPRCVENGSTVDQHCVPFDPSLIPQPEPTEPETTEPETTEPETTEPETTESETTESETTEPETAEPETTEPETTEPETTAP